MCFRPLESEFGLTAATEGSILNAVIAQLKFVFRFKNTEKLPILSENPNPNQYFHCTHLIHLYLIKKTNKILVTILLYSHVVMCSTFDLLLWQNLTHVRFGYD